MHSCWVLVGISVEAANLDLIMKIGIVGAGRVGCACALAAVVRGSARTIVIVDRTRKRAEAAATDLRYGAPLCPQTTAVDGDYEDLPSTACASAFPSPSISMSMPTRWRRR